MNRRQLEELQSTGWRDYLHIKHNVKRSQLLQIVFMTADYQVRPEELVLHQMQNESLKISHHFDVSL